MAAADLDPRSSALDNLHALLKSDKISKRRVSCRVSFLLACLRDDFLLLRIFLRLQIASFNEIHPSEEEGFELSLTQVYFLFY